MEDASRPAVPPRAQLVGTCGALQSPYPTAAPARLLRVLSIQAPSRAGCLEGTAAGPGLLPRVCAQRSQHQTLQETGSTQARLPFLPGSLMSSLHNAA